MASLIRFDGRVAVITGSGGGLGRAYALFLGSRGAKVVVNDLGGSAMGKGSSSRPADAVVEEIRNAGGIAVADYNSVEEGDKIIQTALDSFGRIDILINNAGILRDRSFARTSDTDWDLVHRIHLRGSFLVSRAAWPHMKKQNYGRIIMTSSVAGLYGNFGQANYSAAKLGLVGLSNTLAVEGQKYNIHTNVVAPMGGTRLTEGILPPDLFEELKPELIAPLVAWLSHEDCTENGSIIEAAAGWFGKYRFERSKGHVCRGSLNELVSPEAVRSNWSKIVDFNDSLHPSNNGEAVALLAGVLDDLKGSGNAVNSVSYSSDSSNLSGPMSAVGFKGEPSEFSYDSKDVILYALGVGVSTKEKDCLKFIFEGNEEFAPLPTFIIVPSQSILFNSSVFTGGLPNWTINLANLLHGEQYIKFFKPIPANASLISNMEVVDVVDKGSGAVLIVDVDTKDEKGELIAKSQWTLFVVGEGNFGGPRSSEKAVPLAESPTRTPDAVDEFQTSIDQAALYRLSGDRNPLHIDPSFSALGGFKIPILHGLCSYGIAARAVLKTYCENDVSRFKAIKARFAKPVIPGQNIVTEMWKEGNRIYFKCFIKETKQDCIVGGYVDIQEVENSTFSGNSHLLSTPMFQKIRERLFTNPELVASNKATFTWNILQDKKPASQWTIDLKNVPDVYEGYPKSDIPDVTINMEDNDFVDMVIGKLKPQNAFMSGKLKVTGNLMLIQKLQTLFESHAKL